MMIPVPLVLFGQTGVMDDQQILGIAMLGGFCEVEAADSKIRVSLMSE